MRTATNISNENLALLGTCFGRFTKSKRFRLKVTCLEILAKYALVSTAACIAPWPLAITASTHPQHKVWVRPSAEMTFLYGNHIAKAGLARMTEGIPTNGGVVVLSMSETPLGFGVAAQTTERAQEMDPTGVVVLHQADIGEYVRSEETVM